MPFDLFVSYATRDKPIADAMCATLEQQGIRCWIAPRDILPGRDWSEAIIDAISACSVMVLVFSEYSNASEQVKREVSSAVAEGKPIIPFRIHDVPLSKHMRYFISTPHWLDAICPPLEQHLNYLATTVQSLLQTRQHIRTPEAVDVAPPQAAAAPITLAPNSSDVVHRAGPQSGGALARQLTQLTLAFTTEGRVRHLCLYAQPIVTLGKDRGNDIVLRVFPKSAESDQQTSQISRRHAELRLSGENAEWVNLECRNGTLVNGARLPAHTASVLQTEMTLSPGGVLPLGCDLYHEETSPTGPGRLLASLSQLYLTAVRLRRLDILAGCEQYIVFEHHVSLGRSASSPVLVFDPSVAEQHAEIMHSADGFEIEPCVDRNLLIDGTRIYAGERVPLRPGSRLYIGNVGIDVTECRQLLLDVTLVS